MAISYPKVAEDYYRDKLASLLIEAETEQSTVHGVIDVLTPFEIIEVKKLHKWKEALGQVLAYGHDPEYSSLIKRVHLIVPRNEQSGKALKQVIDCFHSYKVDVSWEYEAEEMKSLIKIGDIEFSSLNRIKQRISKIKSKFLHLKKDLDLHDYVTKRLNSADTQFLIDLVMLSNWSESKFDGIPTAARVKIYVDESMHTKEYCAPFRYLSFSWQLRAVSGQWLFVDLKNYLTPKSLKPLRYENIFHDETKITLEISDLERRKNMERKQELRALYKQEMESYYARAIS